MTPVDVQQKVKMLQHILGEAVELMQEIQDEVNELELAFAEEDIEESPSVNVG